MDAFNAFNCDPAFLDAGASAPANVDGSGYLDFQEAQMWLGGFMNAEMDTPHSPFTPASSPYLCDASASPLPASYYGSPAAMASMPQTPISEIPLPVYAQVYNGGVSANDSFVAEFFPYASAHPSPSIGLQVGTCCTLPPPSLGVQDYDGAIYNQNEGIEASVYSNGLNSFSSTPYNAYEPEQETGAITQYLTLTPDLVATPLEKHDDAQHFSVDEAVVALAETEASCVEKDGRAKSKQQKKKDGDLDWVHCTPIAVANRRNPDSPPTYRVVRSTVRGSQGKSKTSAKGSKRPRVTVIVVDANGKEKRLYFRSCVVKYFDRCKWDGCQDVVWTDRKSIREHMEMAHGVYWDPDRRITCLWENCGCEILIDSLFRHVTNTHMKVIRASCVYGCGEGYSRVDGRNRHSPKCLLRPDVE